MKFLLKPSEEWVLDISYPLSNPLWPKEKDKVPLKWNHHQPKTHTLPKNKVKALNRTNKAKCKINHKMVVSHQMMQKAKFSPLSKIKIKIKLLTTLKMINSMLLNCHLKSNWSVVLQKLPPGLLLENITWRIFLEASQKG